ncbi:RNA methyltransferase [Litoreibacter roseus]|uniref:tRNA (cytidine/uridine-2'-O-)-methyltransferase TrmJ n=1 Tax=Litoreibacter roseus TaxID=2601869 RepID=A0A6N6JL62_9RHOB|nr:RNA methyltransferase [Litoreibacter roseus]GFE66795.1 tRNA (cytidine/uridine-2'-O-)-methyltransferase TrmJ [Litoreibacter roseus]
MSGTDHAHQDDWTGPQPVFVLVEPQMGENIGAAARAMWNFGLEHMRLVHPRDGWPNPKATAMASGASRVLDRLGVFDTTAEAVGDLNYVFATTARARDLTKPVVTPERAMEQARAMTRDGKRVGILFGPERAGLENVDIAQANAIISVPVNPGFASLNLAQCVLLTAYEWRRQTGDDVPEVVAMAKTQFATQLEMDKLYEHFLERLDTAGFFFPEAKAEGMKTTLRNMLSRMPMTQSDTQIFHGMLRQFARWKERGD